MPRGAQEREQIARALQAKGYRYFTLSPPRAQLSGPPQAQLLISRDERGTRRIATLSGTYVQLLQDIEHLPRTR